MKTCKWTYEEFGSIDYECGCSSIGWEDDPSDGKFTKFCHNCGRKIVFNPMPCDECENLIKIDGENECHAGNFVPCFWCDDFSKKTKENKSE
jgi:hypothetical protein